MKKQLTWAVIALFYFSTLGWAAPNARFNNVVVDNNVTGNGTGAITGYYAGALTIYGGAAIDNIFDGAYSMTPKVADFIMKSGPYVDVRAYEAACDNVTDDSAEINAAIAAATRAVYIPGPCLINAATLTGKSGINIFGNGRKSELRTTNTSNFSILTLSGIDNVEVSGITFTGNAVGTDNVNPVIGIDLYQTKNVEITKNKFDALNYDIRILDTDVNDNNSRGTNIHNNRFFSAYGDVNGGYGILHVRAYKSLIHHNIFSPGPFGRHAIYMSAGTRHAIVDHNSIEGSRLAGISVNSGTTSADAIYNLTIDTNEIKGSGISTLYGYGLNVTGGLSDSKITNQIIVDAANDGILIQSASASIFPYSLDISHNQIISSQGTGIALYDVRDSTINSNIVRNSGLDTVALQDIILGNLAAEAAYNTFQNNQTRSALRWGIKLSPGVIANEVSGTIGATTTQERVLDMGSASKINENIRGIQSPSIAAQALEVNCNAGSLVNVALNDNVTISVKTYSPIVGQPLEFIFTQDGTGGRTVTFSGSFKSAWVDTGNTLGKVSSIKFIYDGTYFQQVGAQMLYH